MDDILFRAILALDAYNRGYAPGIASLGGGVGAQIGAASIVAQSDVIPARIIIDILRPTCGLR